jgi:CheY-like chemotaxis protein
MKSNKIICIVDDENINQFIVTTIIKNIDNKITVLTYKNGEDAIESLKKLVSQKSSIPDIILLDINMPVMNGWQFLDEYVKIKSQIDKKIAIYILSSSSNPEDKKKAKTYTEIHDYLSRPLDPSTLKKIIELK